MANIEWREGDRQFLPLVVTLRCHIFFFDAEMWKNLEIPYRLSANQR